MSDRASPRRRPLVMWSAVGAAVVGLFLTALGYMDSCSGKPAPGWSCYSPPWAIPAYDLGRVLLVGALAVLTIAGFAHHRSVTR